MDDIIWSIKVAIKASPVVIVIMSFCYILLYTLGPLSALLIKNMTNILDGTTGFSYVLSIYILVYILTSSFQDIQYSFSIVFIESLEQKLSGLLQKKLIKSIYTADMKLLDKPHFLNKLYRARSLTWYGMTNTLNGVFHLLGLIFSLIVTVVLIAQESTLYLCSIVLLGLMKNMTGRQYLKDKIKKDEIIDKEKRALQYNMELLTVKSNLYEVRAYGLYNWIWNKWVKNYSSLNDIEINFMRQWGIKKGIIEIISFIIENVVIFYLIVSVINNKINIGSFLLLISCKDIIISGIDDLIDSLISLTAYAAYISDLRELINIDDTFEIELPEQDVVLDMKDVYFSYSADKPVLQNINLSIKKGEIVALVGENGCGKSTLAKLAIGLLKPDSGIVKVNRDKISAAYQDYAKFELSLRENVGFGDILNMEKDNKIINAIDKGDSVNVYMKADKNLNKTLGKSFDISGLELSGGEWQKIAISRTFMGESIFIVFDEPASSLDPVAEVKQFNQIIKELENNMGGIIISHRVGLARLSDRILYMEKGVILESGTHDELISYDSKYREFFNSQSQWYRR